MIAYQRLVAIAAALLLPLLASAQGDRYPRDIVKIVVPFPAGGWFDRVARTTAEALQSSLKQTFIVENKIGASGMIAAEFVAKAKADGYTLLLGGQTQNVTAPLLQPKVARFDSLRDFASVALLVDAPNALVVSGTVKARTFTELLALIKSSNGRTSFASNGTGAGPHLAMELLKGEFGLAMNHIPFKGSGPAVAAIAGGHVDTSFATIQDILPLIKSGRVHAIAVSGKRRLQPLPDVPTIAEVTGKDGLESSTWSVLLAPAGTPAPIIAILNAEVNRALADPAVIKKFSPEGEMVLLGGTPEQATALTRAELEKWGKVIKDRNIAAD